MKNEKNKNYKVAKTTKELASALGLESVSDIALIEYKAQLSAMAVKAIEKSGLSVNEVVKQSGVARSKVSAIKNGSIAGISCDLFMKVISAAGAKLSFKMAS
ncbi:MAG: XRE family transcriptional regulator [Bacteriovorax sp.]|nr:XRE family transcriptional regulator [Bacteriovorax sp.]